MTHLETVDTKELGEAIDMIKDLSEAIYYCTITEAMNAKEEPHYEEERKGRMYYGGREGSYQSSPVTRPSGYGTGGYMERDMPIMRDRREGRSPVNRKMYMESKEMHKDKSVQMHELEKYIQELTNDLMEMIEDATPEEKQVLSNKVATLATKIK